MPKCLNVKINSALALNPPILIKRYFALKWRFSLRIFMILGFVLIVLLLIFYVFQVNEVTRASFLISNYQKKIEELSQKNKNLEINFSQLDLGPLLKNLGYEKIEKIYYIQILETQMVTK